MFGKSIRQRIKAVCFSWLPKWLFEDFPKVENSTAVKCIQEYHELEAIHPIVISSYVEPVITEVTENVTQEVNNSLETESMLPQLVMEDVSLQDDRLRMEYYKRLPDTTQLPEMVNSYKPQISLSKQKSDLLQDLQKSHAQISGPNDEPLEREEHSMLDDSIFHTSPLWFKTLTNGYGLLDNVKTNVNSGESGQGLCVEVPSRNESVVCINEELKRKNHLSHGTEEKQTFILGNLTLCITHLNMGHCDTTTDMNSYFPQNAKKTH
ncbi:interleukin-23 receptor-like [Protopterus annectens]|uniref:interleukin-23 receptor-like n=1 Tax=Protopterus annectens TaxID=7888 RepID=UPI001CFA4C0E|nr:interleukin-23 receptor-like [Protopterus annectens]